MPRKKEQRSPSLYAVSMKYLINLALFLNIRINEVLSSCVSITNEQKIGDSRNMISTHEEKMVSSRSKNRFSCYKAAAPCEVFVS